MPRPVERMSDRTLAEWEQAYEAAGHSPTCEVALGFRGPCDCSHGIIKALLAEVRCLRAEAKQAQNRVTSEEG